MLFMWRRVSSGAAASGRACPWLAWLATALLLWRYRRRIARLLFGVPKPKQWLKQPPKAHRHSQPARPRRPRAHLRRRLKCRQTRSEKMNTKGAGGDKKPIVRLCKQFHAGDGPHVISAMQKSAALEASFNYFQSRPKLLYKVTRSGRIYGAYAQKSAPLRT